jgi:hypothetical protein
MMKHEPQINESPALSPVKQFEIRVVEMVRREYLSVSEARLCLSMGMVPEIISENMNYRISMDHLANVPGSKRIESMKVALREHRRIMLLIGPTCN